MLSYVAKRNTNTIAILSQASLQTRSRALSCCVRGLYALRNLYTTQLNILILWGVK